MATALGRRTFITLLGGTAVALCTPPVARAQPVPVIGFLHAGAPEPFAIRLAGFRKGLGEAGYVEGNNLTIEYRWARGDTARLRDMAAELVRRRVAVIAIPGGGGSAGHVAKTATTTIPIVFSVGADPVELGLVASLNRPGGNITGFNDMNSVLGGKRLGLLHELLPSAARFALLVNPAGKLRTASMVADAQNAADAIGRKLDIIKAGTSQEIDTAFAGFAQGRPDALIISTDSLFNTRRIHLITLAAHHRLPTVYPWKEAAEGGGLMFYGTSGVEEYRQVGIYVGRVLKGERPAELPVLRPTRFELVINLHTARTLGVAVPPSLLAIADEVIE